ncbi:unnamed protein product [Vitrella brassicaformis CCMP3155]|uniref:RING-type domain-containing protein n=1 Tax=Vitrella brassicaformis (strain CCMP3155) TaxID=1169540 RepID=A0A0G4G9W8_VITBC|nr:unnamed protein product [Vitrella brassicaformis CCMP3155]|eukprot:CEM25771.1 unnamed protein product [Vitrella brassicaformis CCMP3155]
MASSLSVTVSECSLCKEEYEPSGSKGPRVLRCGHSFCAQCIVALINQHPHGHRQAICPLCKEVTAEVCARDNYLARECVEQQWQLRAALEPDAPMPPTKVVFRVRLPTDYFYSRRLGRRWVERVRLVGNLPTLGSWDPMKGLELTTSDAMYPVWQSQPINVPLGEKVEYKYVTVDTWCRQLRIKWEDRKANRELIPWVEGGSVVGSFGYRVVHDDLGSIPSAHAACITDWLGGSAHLTLHYCSSRDGKTYDDLLRHVGSKHRVVLVISHGAHLFGCYVHEGLQPPQNSSSKHSYASVVWWFSLAGGHFDTPTKVLVQDTRTGHDNDADAERSACPPKRCWGDADDWRDAVFTADEIQVVAVQ